MVESASSSTDIARKDWILGSRDFTFLSLNRFLVTFATQIQAVAMGWFIYQTKKDPLYLGLIGLAEAVPAISLSLVSGWLVDRSKPRTIYRRAIACSTLSALLMWVVAIEAFAPSPDVIVDLVFVSAFLTGLARSFLAPAQFSLLPLAVPRAQLGKATAWNTSLNQMAALSGPALGGFLYAFADSSFCFGAIVALLAAALVLSGQISCGTEAKPHLGGQRRAWEGVFSGVHFVFQNQIILAAMAIDMFAVLFGGVTALLPIFASDVFAKGPMGLGLMRAAMPIGAFTMGWFLIRIPINRFSGRLLLMAITGFGLCMIGFGLSQSFAVSVILLFLAGICDSISVVTRQTILQLSAPEAMRGRIASVSAIFIGSSNEIGAFESGLAAKLLGVRPSVVFGGLVTLLVVLTTCWRAPQLRRLHLSEL